MRTVIFCFLIFPIFAIDYLALIEENFDESISPCDNLYRYVCPINGSKFLEVLFEEYKTVLDEYKTPEKYVDIKKQIESMNKDGYQKSQNGSNPIITKTIETLENLCLNDHNEYARVLKNLESLIPYESFTTFLLYNDCHEAALTLEVTMLSNFLRSDPSKKFSDTLKTIEAFKFYQWNQDNRHAYERVEKTATIIKSFASQLISTTPWIQNINSTKLYETVWNRLFLEEPEYDQSINEAYLDEYYAEFHKCLTILSTPFLTPICHLHTINHSVHRRPSLNLHDVFDAFNGQLRMSMTNPFIYLAGLNLPPAYFLGSVAFVLGHEVGHSYIISHRGEINLPYFPNETRTCIQNQFEKSCQFFSEGECETFDDQFDENGSDVFGYAMMYEVLKFVYGENLNDVVKGTTKNLTNAQLFFISTSTVFCANTPTISSPSDRHHALAIRVNSVTAQNLDFERYFNCPKSSRMVESKTEKCYVLGENAAITK